MALTLEEFLEIVRESGLVGPAVLDATLREIGGEATSSSAEPPGLADALIARGVLSHWQAEKLLAGVHKGFFLGKYKLLRIIAAGTMSSVYEAEHLMMHRRVALKVLPKGLVGEGSFLERFYREARAVARLDHPNIVRGYDVDQEGEYHFFVMEYVEGTSLQQLVETSGPLALEAAARMIRQASMGLDHAHKAGLVHRDIKPSNLLVDREGTVKILDLGLVRSLPQENNEAGLTRLHNEYVLGTVDYLSPEQAIDSHNVDIRSDIYSMGCTFYFLLTGNPPFPSGTLAERLLAHQSRSPTPLTALRAEIPQGLARIVARMLAKRPDDRYQNPGEVTVALDDWLKNLHAPPMPTSEARPANPTLDHPPPNLLPETSPVPVALTDVAPPSTEVPPPSPSDAPPARPSPPLLESWVKWANVVELIAAGETIRPASDERTYRGIYEELLRACRESSPEADETTRRTIRQIEDLVSPWLSLQLLRSILLSPMNASVFLQYHEIDRVLRNRPAAAFSSRVLLIVAGTIAVLVLIWVILVA